MFSVYLTTKLFTSPDKVDEHPVLSCENRKPLDASAAMALAKECSQRVMVGHIRVVDVEDDATVFEWHYELGVIFPEQLKGKW